VLIGAGLIVLSLEMLAAAAAPLRDSQTLPLILSYLGSDAISAFALAAVLTYLLHSSIAAVLLLAALAAQGVVPVETGLVMVLGINLGSSVIAPVLTRAAPPEYRAVPLANLLMRGLGSVLLLGLLEVVQPDPALLGRDAAEQIVHAHIAFNLAVLVLGLPLSGLAWRLSLRLARMGGSAAQPHPETSALDPAALEQPEQALANATREAVRMCETLDAMLTQVIGLYDDPSQDAIEDLRRLDDQVDTRHNQIKLYLARIAQADMTEAQSRRCQNLLETCIKLEQAGDIVVRNLLLHIQKKKDRQVDFTPEGWNELRSFHSAVLRNARLAFNLLVFEDTRTARHVMEEKDRLREMERDTRQRHFDRLRSRTERSIETSSIHLDTVRDLKQINALLASIAYPVLEAHNLLSDTRLKAD
jgi:phosphate:Na+ symporter